MAPGAWGMPPARGPDGADPDTVDVAARLAPYLATLPPRRVLLLRLALRAFEWSPFPWRFSRASLEARQDFLRKMDSSTSWIRQDMLLLLKVITGSGYADDPRVRAAVGSTAYCRVEVDPSGRAPEAIPPQPLGDLVPRGEGEDCDVAIVGSGAGGAVAASVLAAAGLDVLVLEAGPYMDRRTYPDEPLEALVSLYRDGGLTIAEGIPAIPTPVGRAVGGTTVINSGTCFRAPDPVLSRWREQHGVEWATELDGEYAEAEEFLHVTPVDPERMGRNGQLLMEGAEALGVSHHPLSRNAGRCIECGSCPYGCRLDAKRAMHVSYLPRAVAAGARVRAGVEARRVVFEGGRATGLECVRGVARQGSGSPRPFTVRARRAVIVAGGAFGTPELLLRSGVRSRSGELGRNLRIHPACWVGARFDEEVRGWEGVMQSYAVDEWKHDGLLLEATFTPLAFGGHWMPGIGADHQERLAGYRHVASTGVHLSDTSRGRVGIAGDGSLRITYRLNRADTVKLTFGIARAAELLYAAGAREVFPQIAGLPIIPRGRINELDARAPHARRLRLEAFHPLGTARMDADAARGVVAPDGAVHGYDSLYVADGSIFPSSIGVNPMMTIIAMAARIARGIAGSPAQAERPVATGVAAR
ncbi:MAG TPA: GMC family oxidoreductase [Solirubrobacterales bacterium]|nr:GMC family oxidoreductase [Solirubrobacterales bacterium]